MILDPKKAQKMMNSQILGTAQAIPAGLFSGRPALHFLQPLMHIHELIRASVVHNNTPSQSVLRK